MNNFLGKCRDSILSVLPSTFKTCIWVIKLTVGVSFLILLLRYFNILPWISNLLTPLFSHFGLPGEASLAFVSGYFVNVYSAIAIAVTIDMDMRSITILAVMVLCAHNMIVESAVQKKTGTSAVRIVLTRTLSAFVLAYILNLLLPNGAYNSSSVPMIAEDSSFLVMFKAWIISSLQLVIKMSIIIFSLNIVQRLLSDFGVMEWISQFLSPLLKLFGLPLSTSFLWIIANTVGLAYGAAAMLDETKAGNLSEEDINKINLHICISHSNIEDLLLFVSIGGIWWVVLLTRWLGSCIIVWGYRLELIIRNKFIPLRSNN